MDKFSISEKYRLEIRCKKAIYDKEGVANLMGCYLCGPVINDVAQMNADDSILLDFSNQYIVFVPNYYVARLSWRQVKHVDNVIYLYDAKLSNSFINSVPKLNVGDHILVDTKNHEDNKHQHHLTYPAYLVKHTGELHIFRSR